MTANYDFLEPKAVALTQDVYMAPNSVTAEWHERQLHLFCTQESNEQRRPLCVLPHASSL